jgi:hypothetical protein
VLGCLVCVTLVLPLAGQAEEQAEKFLNGLRDRGYADMALEYLDRMETSPLCPPDLKKTMAYERGVTLVLAGRLERDPNLQEAKLNQAQKTLQDFINRNPQDPLVEPATDQLGNVVLERARSKIDQADRPKNADKKEQLLEQGRAFYTEAFGIFEKRLEALRRRLMDPKFQGADPEKQPELVEQRDALRGSYVQSQLMAATVVRKKAETYPENSAEYKAGLKEAVKYYEEVYKKYRTRLAGLYARLYQARCLQQIGGAENFIEAITIYEEMLEQPYKAEPLRDLRTKTIRMALECWIDAPPMKKDQPKNYEPAIGFSSEWLRQARPKEEEEDEWLGLQYWLAMVYKTAAEALDDKNPNKKKYEDASVKLARHVAKFQGEFQKDAQKLLGRDTGTDPVFEEPTDFAEARTGGRDALEQIQLLRANIPKMEAQAKKATGKNKTELEAQVAKAKDNLAQHQENALKYFRRALALADEDTSINDKNIIHYFLCYLYYMDESYYNAAVVGEFLATHYPSGTGARPCAKIAMASYLKLYKANESDDRDFEIQKTVDVADYIVRKWPTQPESQEALNTLIPFMIKLKRLDDAEKYLQQIDPESPHRGDAELKTGQAMWSQYLLGMQSIKDAQKQKDAGQPVDESKLPKKTELDELKKRAETTLANGIQRMRESAAVDRTLALAALSLAQVYVDTEQPLKAVELIEDENVGPKTLVEKKHPAAQEEAYQIETYKVALRAYIGALPAAGAGPQGEALMAKAEGVMNALKKRMGATSEGQRRLIGIYISLATDIQKQIDRATAATRGALIRGFEAFLSRVGEATTDIKELFWVAQTFYGLGEASGDDSGQLSADAREFYAKSIATYEKILKMAGSSKELTPEMVMQVQMRLANSQRKLQQYKTAMDLFEEILLARNMMLNVQVEAATTYQEWAKIGEPVLYERAIMGGRTNKKTGKYTIWGWGKIANQTAPTKTDKYKDIFYKARYNLAFARFNQAKRQKTAEERKSVFQLAKNDIALTYRFYPEMGGDKWRPQFDALLKQIQQALGEQPTGLAGLDDLTEGPAILKSAE